MTAKTISLPSKNNGLYQYFCRSADTLEIMNHLKFIYTI